MRKLLLAALLPVGLATGLCLSQPASAATSQPNVQVAVPAHVQHADYYYRHRRYRHRRWDRRHRHWDYY